MSTVPGRDDADKPSDGERLVERLGPAEEQRWPTWVTAVRQVVIFTLGVVIICYAIISKDKNFGYIVTGLILIGMIPIENLINRLGWGQPRKRRDRT